MHGALQYPLDGQALRGVRDDGGTLPTGERGHAGADDLRAGLADLAGTGSETGRDPGGRPRNVNGKIDS